MNYTKLFFLLAISFIALLNACTAGDSEAEDGINKNEIILLNESQVSNFMFVLPDILDFSSKYQSRLTEEEKNSPGANEKFFKYLGESSKIKESYLSGHFKTIDELVLVYKNIVLAYTSIKRELTNYSSDIIKLSNNIYEYRTNYTAQLRENKLEKSAYLQISNALASLESDEMRYRNILLVKKYESEIDKIEQTYGQ